MKTYVLLLTIPMVLGTFGDLGDNGLGDGGATQPGASIFGAASAVCQTPVTADALAAKATVCGASLYSSQGLRTFVNAGELLRHNCRNGGGQPFFLVANTTCQAYAASAAAVGIAPASQPLV